MVLTQQDINTLEAQKKTAAGILADIHIFKMPKGSRHAGQFAVCSEIEYLNTY